MGGFSSNRYSRRNLEATPPGIASLEAEAALLTGKVGTVGPGSGWWDMLDLPFPAPSNSGKWRFTLPETNEDGTWKWMVGRRSRFLLGPFLFSGAKMLVSESVIGIPYGKNVICAAHHTQK